MVTCGRFFRTCRDAGRYVRQLATSVRWIDFVVLGLKTFLFGMSIAVVSVLHGLARMLRLEEVSNATVRAVAQTVWCAC